MALRKPELSGRMSKWSLLLSAYDIKYAPRTAIKAQALADFVADFSPTLEEEAKVEMAEVNHVGGEWIMFVDGASNQRGSGLGVVLKSPQGDTMVQAFCCDFGATNNEAEYEALIAGMSMAKELGATRLKVYSDSLLIVCQMTGGYVARDAKMMAYLDTARNRRKDFQSFSIEQVPRGKNALADALASLGSALRNPQFGSVPIAHLTEPAIKRSDVPEIMAIEDGEQCWTKPFLDYFIHNIQPADRNEARKLRARATRYMERGGTLYRKSASGVYQRCVSHGEQMKILDELHSGRCSTHIGGDVLAALAKRQGYYWPTMKADAKSHVTRCDACQRYAHSTHKPAEILHQSLVPWPFMKWGMDIVGKLPQGAGQKVFMLAMTDYFSKWIEAEALAKVTSKKVISFIYNNIICRFGVPSEIVCDNGSQFISSKTREFLKEYNIILTTSTPRYPQANGQAESSNKAIIGAIKKRLDQAKGAWTEQLPLVLWANRTTPKVATGQTPFALVYGCEAVLPVEAVVPSTRRRLTSAGENCQRMEDALDDVDELREAALVRTAAQQQVVARCFNKNVKAKVFCVGDWVLRRAFQNTKDPAAGKLAPPWEGPYQIIEVIGKGAYRLRDEEGRSVPRSWNAAHLKKYYF